MFSRSAVILQMAAVLGATATAANAADTERLSAERVAKIYAAYETLDPAASPDVLSRADVAMIKAAFAAGGADAVAPAQAPTQLALVTE